VHRFCHPDEEAPGSSETSGLTRATRRNNPEDTILHSHRRENLKSYMDLFCSIISESTKLCYYSTKNSEFNFNFRSKVDEEFHLQYFGSSHSQIKNVSGIGPLLSKFTPILYPTLQRAIPSLQKMF
jgi:hypothetical protein